MLVQKASPKPGFAEEGYQCLEADLELPTTEASARPPVLRGGQPDVENKSVGDWMQQAAADYLPWLKRGLELRNRVKECGVPTSGSRQGQ
jgi:hypothetical protein